ncbi:hypothetical protein [Mycolicibacterium peregrinum]|nr:hypothetical protein [Mycolicibacterium peregrinum]
MSVQDSDARDVNRLAPDYLAHWVVKTARSDDPTPAPKCGLR